jgi:terminase small subunit / prophage DNA-packing protein
MTVQSIGKSQVLRIANKLQVAEFFEVSPLAVDGWIRRGCPVVGRGERGKAWKLDLLEVAKWRFKPAVDTSAPGQLDGRQERARLDRAKANLAEDNLMLRRGQLIPAEDFRQALSDAFKTVAMTLESLPDLLERDAGLPPQAVDKTIQIIDKLREQMYERLSQPNNEAAQ